MSIKMFFPFLFLNYYYYYIIIIIIALDKFVRHFKTFLKQRTITCDYFYLLLLFAFLFSSTRIDGKFEQAWQTLRKQQVSKLRNL